MQFSIKQSVLKEELGYIQGVVEKKSTIPVLSNILIESIGDSAIRMVGTDLDVTIRCDAAAEIKTPGAICIQARKLFDIIRTLSEGDIHFKKEDNEWVEMKAGRAKIRLAGVNREQYPEIPAVKSTPAKLPAEVFSYFIQNTAFAITNETSRFTLSGAKLIVDKKKARMVTTDGHRLAFIEKELENGPEVSIDTLVPKKALMELVKLSRGVADDISFGEDDNHLYFQAADRLLTTRKLTGNFPNYEMVMPKDNDKKVVFDLNEMRSVVRRIALVADERSRSIRINVAPGEIEVTAQSADEGSGSEFVSADYTGEPVTLGFNHQYLQEFLNNVGALEAAAAETEGSSGESDGSNAATARAREDVAPTRISFEFKDSNAATQIRIDGDTGYDYKYIVMPLRI